ncbi:MAG: phosphoribosylaminoimidazole-succinocarboxamide synthase [Lysobacteraceae bacterium]|nr:MAG: phosphoribosylaminoimidazole-succinocarboxamide synthase [Xanthomonadaceae bacterium]
MVSLKDAILEARLDLPLVHRGKVRDVFAVDDDRLLMVACDRISAFDVVMPQAVPGKGAVLTAISNFWFDRLAKVVPNHLISTDASQWLSSSPDAEALVSRSVLVKRLKPLPVEAIVRGYLIGSGWKDYQSDGRLCGIELPSGLKQAQELPQPIFTPSTKAAVGDHDENIAFDQVIELIGEDLANQVREVSLTLYSLAARYALHRGIIIADTKFEFGLDADGSLVLMDEILTPDSSRFWPVSDYQVGSSPPSFDKQFVRDYLETLDWDKKAPGPNLPDEIITGTAERYAEAWTRLTGPAGL